VHLIILLQSNVCRMSEMVHQYRSQTVPTYIEAPTTELAMEKLQSILREHVMFSELIAYICFNYQFSRHFVE
jgi:hypothetical protein